MRELQQVTPAACRQSEGDHLVYPEAVHDAPLRVLDLFAGAGGLTEGFHRAGGYQTVAAVELDEWAAASYSMNHPDVDLFVGDIAEWVRGSLPHTDVVVGGPPCQGFSALGARRVRDPRNALWRRYVDTLERTRPICFVLENVATFLKSGQFHSLLNETRPSGKLRNYRIEPFVLNAAEYGVPQVRKRAVLLGSLRDIEPMGAPQTNLGSDRATWRTVRETIGDLSAETNGVSLPGAMTNFAGRSMPGPFKTLELHLGRRPTPLSMERYLAIPPGGNRNNLPDHLKADCWRDHKSGSGDVMGRLHWNRPSVTIRTEFWKPEKGRYLHPEAHRAITHLEAARLQGFPDDYLWCGPKQEIGRQIGNAVPVDLATGIAQHLKQRLGRS